MRASNFLRILSASLVALLSACSSGDGGGPSCETEANCPARSRCVERLCVADAPPIARIAGPGETFENTLVTFDGSGSSDPDEGDAIVAWRWALRPVNAACSAAIDLPSASAVKVRFPCAGTWGVDLVVTDALGTESAAASHDVTVKPWTGAPRVTVGEDVTLAHACAGDPLRCTTVNEEGNAVEIALAAHVAATDADPASLRYAWTVAPPPGLALGDDRRVVVTPGPEDGSATAVIETAGTAIAGQWVFTVEVHDASGLIGTADQVVTVENREPTIVANVPAAFDHRYDASRRFLASGTIPLTVVDPDGDPVQRSILARHLNDGPNDRFEAVDDGSAITFFVEVLYETPEDAHHLIGSDVLREIDLTVEDVNGAIATTTLPVVIGNRPPRPAQAVTSVSTGHVYDAETATYRATATLTRWVDDDGDPIYRDESTNNGACPTLEVDVSGRARVQCALPFQGIGTLAQFAASHVVDQRVRDPFGWGEVIAPATVAITNRAPKVTAVDGAASVTCSEDIRECCEWDFELKRCVVPLEVRGEGSAVVSPTVSDPDGDPVVLVAESCALLDQQLCTGGACSVQVRTCATGVCLPDPASTHVTFTVSDGVATGTDYGSVNTTCQ